MLEPGLTLAAVAHVVTHRGSREECFDPILLALECESLVRPARLHHREGEGISAVLSHRAIQVRVGAGGRQSLVSVPARFWVERLTDVALTVDLVADHVDAEALLRGIHARPQA